MLAIIIVNYKADDLAINFVSQECRKIHLPHKIVIVNNAANRVSNKKIAASLNGIIVHDISLTPSDNEVYIIDSPENLGFAKGNNLGACFCKKHFAPDYFLFTNTDIRIKDADICERLIQVIEEKKDIGIIGPRVIGLKGESQSPNRKFDLWYNNVWYFIGARFKSKKQIRKGDYASSAKEGYHYQVMGSFFLVPSQSFYECGMFDSHTFLYYEESILSERMLRIGKRAYFYPSVSVVHEHGATTKKYLDILKIEKMKYDSAAYYYRTYREKSNLELKLVWFIHSLIIRLIYLKKNI